MFSKPIRFVLFLGLAISLVACGAYPVENQVMADPLNAPVSSSALLVVNNASPTLVTGPIFTQPVGPNGTLYLSAWLDPDGSDFDQYVWDNFTLQSNETITEIDWYGGYDPLLNGMGGAVMDFTVAIYPSIAAGTEPAVANPPLVTYQTGGNAGETAIGSVNGVPMYAYAFILPVSFNAVAGVKYWVQIEAWQQGASPDWSLAAATGGDGSHYRRRSGAGGDIQFGTVPGDVAFTLLGLVPATPTDILLDNASVAENQPGGTVIGSLMAASPDPNATFTFSLGCASSGVDDTLFTINGTNLLTSATFDFETRNAYDICIRVTDQGGLFLDTNFIVTVTDVNERPTGLSLSNALTAENQPVNTVVGTLGATDPDAGETFTFKLACALAGADDSAFNILGSTLRTFVGFNYETKTTYNICVSVTDHGGLAFDQNLVIMVNNINEAPTNISLAGNMVAENQPVNVLVGALSASDPDAGATYAFGLTCAIAGADDAAFNVSGTSLRTSAVFDYETRSVYTVCIRVTDQGGLTFDKTFTVTVTNVNELPTDISLTNTAVDENQPVNVLVGALSASDPDAGATFAFGLTCATAGADDAAFNVSGTSLRTSAVFDYETRSVYTVCVRVTDQGGLFYDKSFTIMVNNLVENSAPTDIALANSLVAENQPLNTLVGGLTASDPDAGDTFTFSLTCSTGGADDGAFNILGADLRTSGSFNFEAQSSHSICIRVTDQGGLTFDKNFVIAVTNVNEAPASILLSNNAVDENQPLNTVVGMLSATDPDAGATLIFSLGCASPGVDDGSFNILGTDLRTSTVFDFETKSTYSICVRVTDEGGLTFDRNFVVTVNNLAESINTPCKVTGGGNIDLPQGGKLTFGFVVQYDAGAGSPSGNLTFMDHTTQLSLKGLSFTLVCVSDTHATITGYATLDGALTTAFILDLYDNGEPGSADVFMIQIPELNGYSVGGVINGGNIQITR